MLRGLRMRPLMGTAALALLVGLLLPFFGGADDRQPDIPSLLFAVLYCGVQPEFEAFFSLVWALFPYMLFLLLRGGLLGEDLGVVSIYWFTRTKSRLSWYAGKTLLLFAHVLLYTVGLFGGICVHSGLIGQVTGRLTAELIPFALQWILFFYTTSLVVNLFGCKFPSHLVLLFSLGGILLLLAAACAATTVWCFRLDPITSYFYLWNGLCGEVPALFVIWGGCACITVFSGYLFIRRIDVALSDKENT